MLRGQGSNTVSAPAPSYVPSAKAGRGVAEAASDDRREQMLRAAIDVIAERGFPETRISTSDVVSAEQRARHLLLRDQGPPPHRRAALLRGPLLRRGARRLDAIDGARTRSSPGPDELLQWRMTAAGVLAAVAGPVGPAVRPPRSPRTARSSTSAGATRCPRSSEPRGQRRVRAVDVDDFTLRAHRLLDGLAVQVALGDPTVSSERATQVTMRLVAASWASTGSAPAPAQPRPGRRPSRVKPAAAAGRRGSGR